MIDIAIDTREQLPFLFRDFQDVGINRQLLDTGDYTLLGHETEVTIERKSLSDLIVCLTHDRDRFKRELERMRCYRSAAIVVEEPAWKLKSGCYNSQMKPWAAWQSVVSIMQEYRLPFQFCDGREDAERFVYDFLRHFQRHEHEKGASRITPL